MSPLKKTLKALKENGFVLLRHGGSHDIYFNPKTNTTVPVKRHDFDENDMRYIFKEANIRKG